MKENKSKYNTGDIIKYIGHAGMVHECRIVETWEDEGRRGVTIEPTGNYGFPIDLYEDQLEKRLAE